MKLVPIFVNESSYEGLYSIQFKGEKTNEFRKLIMNWRNTEYVENYCYENKEYLNTEFFNGITLDKLIEIIGDESIELYDYLKSFTYDSFSLSEPKLHTIFTPLIDRSIGLLPLEQFKFKRSKRLYPNQILRIYAIRIAENIFVITGGGVKLTAQMKDHPDLQIEKDKLDKVRKYLQNDLGIQDSDDLMCYFDC